MMSLECINRLADEAGEQARQEGLEPHLIISQEEIDKMPPFPFPNIGSYRPVNWTEIDQLFCDSSGVGSPGEPALTIEQLIAKLEVGNAYAIIETGQFQLYIGVFKPCICHHCKGPRTGRATDMQSQPICLDCCINR